MLQVIYVIINNLMHKLLILVKVLVVVCLFIGFDLWISKWL